MDRRTDHPTRSGTGDASGRAELPTGDEGRPRSFGLAAEAYDRARPSPPVDAVRWMLAGATGVVLDLGAGTGQISRMLVDSGLAVVAVEPDAHMRAVLRRRCPRARVLDGRAEDLPLDDQSLDVVLVGSAWHWFDPDAAVRETARVLRPGGRLAIASIVPDPSSDWIAAMLDGDRAPGGLRGAHATALAGSEYFVAAENWEHGFDVGWSRHDVLALFSTSSRYLVAEPEQRARLRDRWEGIVTEQDTDGDLVRLPLRAWAWRATRSSEPA